MVVSGEGEEVCVGVGVLVSLGLLGKVGFCMFNFCFLGFSGERGKVEIGRVFYI